MSTEHQKYSTDNQSEAIRRYAQQRNFEIVRTYIDAGRSGLSIEGRDGLLQLLADVEKGTADFSVIVVYDISRWGRFQDADEAAAYEYRCRAAGVRVVYCAEQFENDGSIGSDVQKIVKRRMAAEYSRELSVKVFAGQSRLIQLGFRQGGPPGFGLRRQLVDERGDPKGKLFRNQHKSIQTDRVVLVPGPAEEIAIVQEIYHNFVKGGLSESEIARHLNDRKIRSDLEHEWTRGAVHQILINEKYIGNNVWNQRSFKLKKQRVRNSPELWVRSDGAFDPLVDRKLFDAAQGIIKSRSYRMSDEDMLARLRILLSRSGALSGLIIDEADECPSSSVYQNRFGSLLNAYRLIGYSPDRDYRYMAINRALRSLHPDIVDDVIAGIKEAGGRVIRHAATDLLQINGEFSVSVVVVRCRETPAGSLRWHIRLDRGLLPDLTIAVRMNRSNTVAQDYLILPTIDMSSRAFRVQEYNGISLDAYLFETLSPVFEMAERVALKEVA